MVNIQIDGRHVEVTDNIKEFILKRLEAILPSYPRVENCHVIVLLEKYRYTVTVDIKGREHLKAESVETNNDLYAAVDAAVVKVDKQLRKSRQKMLDNQKDRHNRQRLADLPTKEDEIEE